MSTKLKSWAFLVLAIGFAGATLVLATRVNQGKTTDVRQEVVVAKGTLPRGTVLTVANLELAACPLPVPLEAMRKVEEALGQVLVRSLEAGQPVLSSDVARPGTTEAMQAQLRNGMRLLTVHPEEPRNPRESLRPGNYVDIVAVFEKGPQTRRWESEIVLQRVRVAGVGGGEPNPKTGGGRSDAGVAVTLEIPAEEVEMLARVAATSRLHLTLRSADDDAWISPPSRPVPPPPPPVAERPSGPPPGARQLVLRFGARQEVRWYVEHFDELGRPRWVEWKPEPAGIGGEQVARPAAAVSAAAISPVP